MTILYIHSIAFKSYIILIIDFMLTKIIRMKIMILILMFTIAISSYFYFLIPFNKLINYILLKEKFNSALLI